MELIKGLHLTRNLKNVRNNELDLILNILHSGKILNLNLDSAIKAGELSANLENTGNSIGIEDVMIGAICVQNKESLITRNKKNFEKIGGLKIISY